MDSWLAADSLNQQKLQPSTTAAGLSYTWNSACHLFRDVNLADAVRIQRLLHQDYIDHFCFWDFWVLFNKRSSPVHPHATPPPQMQCSSRCFCLRFRWIRTNGPQAKRSPKQWAMNLHGGLSSCHLSLLRSQADCTVKHWQKHIKLLNT